MKLADTHAHLYWDSFQEDLDQVIQRAKDAGLTYIINIGVDVETSKKAAEQAKKLSRASGIYVFSSIGIHPESGQTYHGRYINVQKDMALLEEVYNRFAKTPGFQTGDEGEERFQDSAVLSGEALESLKHKKTADYQSAEAYRNSPEKIVAVGECGLDYLPKWAPDQEAKDMQKKLFQAQIDLAKKLNLPLLVHCRDDRSQDPDNTEAWSEVIKMTKDHFGIYHCYSGLPQTTNTILQIPRLRSGQATNFLISFAGNLTYPQNQYLREAVKLIPLDRIVTETDCPFLPPQSKRGQRNEPSFVLEVAQTIAEIKGMNRNEVSNQTTQNLTNLLSRTKVNTL